MKHSTQPNSDHGSSPPSGRQPTPRRIRLRFSLLSLLLLMAAVASWIAYWRIVQQTETMEAKIPGLRDIARTLVIDDATQYAAVQEHELWNDDFRWKVFLPQGQRYQLHLATADIEARDLAAADSLAAIDPGQHAIELQYDKQGETWRITVLLDGQSVLTSEQPADWNPGRGSSGGSTLGSSQQSLTIQPLILFRRLFTQPLPDGSFQVPQQAAPGILIWIDTVKEH